MLTDLAIGILIRSAAFGAFGVELFKQRILSGDLLSPSHSLPNLQESGKAALASVGASAQREGVCAGKDRIPRSVVGICGDGGVRASRQQTSGGIVIVYVGRVETVNGPLLHGSVVPLGHSIEGSLGN